MSSPAEADLIFEISWVLTDTGLKLPALGQLRMLVLDPKTRVTLWNFTEYVRGQYCSETVTRTLLGR